MKSQLIALSVALGICFASGNVQAHEIFQDVLKERYYLKSFSCKVCHPDTKDRKIRSMFAEHIYQELKEKNLTEKWAEVEPQGDEAIQAFEESIVPDFKKAMDVVEKKQFTVKELILHGLFYGARIDDDQMDAIESALKEE